ncbi:MAG: nucleotide exchange factor GrpE [Treponema sp.]|jgi:molecular chaperone GrpE|nr:nucleotide exchange factor GrpE [Treponema sp.]
MSKHFSYNKKDHHKGAPEGKEAGITPEQPGTEAHATAQDSSQDRAAAGRPGDVNGQAARDTAGPASGETADGSPATEEPGGQEQNGVEDTELTPEDHIASLEAQLAEAKNQFLRKVADFENFRKRMNREKQDAIDFANQSLLLDIIPVLDDFDRAIQSAASSRDFDALYEGLGMIAKRLSSTLESKWGLKSYAAAGALFDPNFHEALMMEKSSAVSEQTVQIDLLKGYTLKDRVIRSAKVKVLIPDPAAPAIAVPAPAVPGETKTGEGAGNVQAAQVGETEAQL